MDKSLLFQKQIKDNADDLHNFVRDLKLWEEEMKRKDRQLSKEPTDEALPPVRRPKITSKSLDKKECIKKKLTSYDYSSWDKFDVDKACEEIDSEGSEMKEEPCEEATQLREKYLKEKALYEKEMGNKHVKSNKWDEAICCYTRAIEAYSKDPVYFANRALCYLKKNKYELVESDCTASLRLDPTYVKAMLRRAAAREALGRVEDASFDLRNALKLEPNNSQALRDLGRLKEVSNKKTKPAVSTKSTTCKVDKESISQSETSVKKEPKNTLSSHSPQVSTNEPEWTPCDNIINPIVKPPHLRSKKALKRIEIYDVGSNMPEHICAAIQRPDTSTLAEPDLSSRVNVESRSIVTMTSLAEDVPLPPTSSVQFHKEWCSMQANPQLRYKYLKQIPGGNFPDIFKDALESRVFSSIIETLASQLVSKDDPVLSYLRGLTKVKRFSTLTLFMSPSDKSNLAKLFAHCLRKAECQSEEINELRKLYEMG